MNSSSSSAASVRGEHLSNIFIFFIQICVDVLPLWERRTQLASGRMCAGVERDQHPGHAHELLCCLGHIQSQVSLQNYASL